MKKKPVCGYPLPNGKNIQFLYQDCGRMQSAAKLVGNIEDESILALLSTAEGFKKLVSGIGVRCESTSGNSEGLCTFALQFYGVTDPYVSGGTLEKEIPLNGAEEYIPLDLTPWTGDEKCPGQIRFEFSNPSEGAEVTVKLYLNEGFDVPEEIPDRVPDFTTEEYKKMITRSVMNYGNLSRIQKAMKDARSGREVVFAFIGGSITQGAGAVPINDNCYARQTYLRFCDICGRKPDDNIKYIKKGVGGTPSELGMLRYDRDITDNGKTLPDIVVVEFAVNDGDDETKGVCFESLVKKILKADNKPAVMIPFSVFADDFNLQDRLAPIGFKYNLPMVSLKNACMPEFYSCDKERAVIHKNEYFYDQYHPTNAGHIIAADCLLEIFKEADRIKETDIPVKTDVKPAIGDDYSDVIFVDKKDTQPDFIVEEGSFSETDKELQSVEMNMDMTQTPEFPYNWHHVSGSDKLNISCKCSKLLVIFKDQSSPEFGTAEVYENDKLLLTMDPHIVGWVHCHAAVVFNEKECKEHNLCIKMKDGDEGRKFTILGFGIVR